MKTGFMSHVLGVLSRFIPISPVKNKLSGTRSISTNTMARDECVSFHVSHLPRGLYYLSLKYDSSYILTGPKVTVERPYFETTDHIFTFIRRDQKELFGTILIVDDINAVNFYPSKLPCQVSVEEFSLRRINAFARDYIYGETFVRSKIFGASWTLERIYEDARASISRLVKGGLDDSYSTWWKLYGEVSEIRAENYIEIIEGWRTKRISNNTVSLPNFTFVIDARQWTHYQCIETIESFKAQLYTEWKVQLIEPVGTGAKARPRLDEIINSDHRINVASSAELSSVTVEHFLGSNIAADQYFGWLSRSGQLCSDALFHFASKVLAEKPVEVIYSDHDVFGIDGNLSDHFFKPDWNHDLFCSFDYITDFFVIRGDCLEKVVKKKTLLQSIDPFVLILRASELLPGNQIGHISRVLFHSRADLNTKPGNNGAIDQNIGERLEVLKGHLERLGIDAYPSKAELLNTYRIHYRLKEPEPQVSIIIPTKNNLRVLKNCIDSILEKTIYREYEIIIVDNDSDDKDILDYFASFEGSTFRVIRYRGDFNFSALNNYAIENSNAEVVVLLNNDTEVCNEDWLNELVSQASRPDVGAVGAKLFYAEDRIQHAGVILGMGPDRVASHAFKGLHKDEVSYMGRARLVQETSAVTGACLAVSRDKYIEVGGLDSENLAIAFNDVDFCLKLKVAGYRNIWTPYAQLYHYESYSRGYDVTPEKRLRFEKERDYMHSRWQGSLGLDSNYNPNLTRDFDNFNLAWPPDIT